jgi:formylglycine-generating enzyme required for sulfatase activity
VPPLDPTAEAPCETAKVRVGDEQRCLRIKELFKDCAECPEMVVVASGELMLGSPLSEPGRSSNEGPQHRVVIASPFAVGRYETTFDEWDACVDDGACQRIPNDRGWGKGRHPVIDVSWDDVKPYLAWLSNKSGHTYRLLTEAEWEYAARAGTMTPFSRGETISSQDANFDGGYTYGNGLQGEYRKRTMEVGMFQPNAFGLYDMHGNVWEWVVDCWHKDYVGAPQNAFGWNDKCSERTRVLRGGSWADTARTLRSAHRNRNAPDHRNVSIGFRVARSLDR